MKEEKIAKARSIWVKAKGVANWWRIARTLQLLAQSQEKTENRITS